VDRQVEEARKSFLRGVKIEGFIVRLVGFPTGENDTNPLECQLARYDSSALSAMEHSTARSHTRLGIQALAFLCSNKIEILNVASPRESKETGVYKWTLERALTGILGRNESTIKRDW
jgi:hypothetical protein